MRPSPTLFHCHLLGCDEDRRWLPFHCVSRPRAAPSSYQSSAGTARRPLPAWGLLASELHYLLSQTYSFTKVPLKKYENPLSPTQSQLVINPAAAPSKPIPYARSDSRRQHPTIVVTIDWLLFTRQWGPKHTCFNSHTLPSLLPIFVTNI